jgi:carbonic anhydrase
VIGKEAQQRPFGIVLGCADSRVPSELIFGCAVNDLFVVRLAGNTVSADAVGSIAYAVNHFDTVQSILVLGHTLCGAVATAVDLFLKPRGYLDLAGSLPLRSLVDRIQVGVRASAMALEDQYGSRVSRLPGYGWALLDLSVFLNAAYVAFCLRAELPPDLLARLEVMFGVYDLATGIVSSGATASSALAPPPAGADAFRALALSLAGGPRIAGALAPDGRSVTV